MNAIIVLLALVACVSAHDVKGIKTPSGNRNYFMPPSRRAVAQPVNYGKPNVQNPLDNGQYGKTQEPVGDYQPVHDQQPIKGYEPVKPYQDSYKGYEPVKGYEPQRPVPQKPIDHVPVKGQNSEAYPVDASAPQSPIPQEQILQSPNPQQVHRPPSARRPYYQPQQPSQVPFGVPQNQPLNEPSPVLPIQGPQAPQNFDSDESNDEFDGPTQPALDSNDSLSPQELASSPVPESPLSRQPVPQSPNQQVPALRSPNAYRPYYQSQPSHNHQQYPQEHQQYQPQQPQQKVPQEPQQYQPQPYQPQQPQQVPQEPQQYQPQQPQQVPQEPQQGYVTYARRPATTLLRTPNGFYSSPGLAAYPMY